ncbi:MAG: hypothetical protein ACI8Q6_003087 [Granulosicoccus sp.]|jgi:hypothetical protein
MSRILYRLYIITACAAAFFGSQTAADDWRDTIHAASPKSTNRVLFVGNSFTGHIATYLPGLLAEGGYDAGQVEFFTAGNAELIDYTGSRILARTVNHADWDYVVLQEQSQKPALPAPYVTEFYEAVETLVAMVRRNKAEPLLFMTWGYDGGSRRFASLIGTYEKMQNRLAAGYGAAARRNEIGLVPVGLVFQSLWAENPKLAKRLYSIDRAHLSSEGSYVASLVFYRYIFDEDNVVAPPVAMFSQIELAQVEALIARSK